MVNIVGQNYSKETKFSLKENLLSFIANIGHEILPEVRENTARGQHPYVTVISCSDSRCSPELIFTEGIGLLFVVRVAGNIIDKSTLGSIEYGIEHCKTKLLLVLGHQQCGAVIAALGQSRARQGLLSEKEEKKEKPEEVESIHNVINKILPITNKAVHLFEDDTHALKWSVEENIRNSKRTILDHSPIVRSHLESGAISVKMGIYHLKTGKVTEVHEDSSVIHS